VAVTTSAFQLSKMLMLGRRKGDLKRLRVLSIIPSCEWLYSSDGCLLLLSANDGEGCCVLYG
jgi:hypothetical protein